MSDQQNLTVLSASAQDTSDLAEALAPHLQVGDVLLLSGDVGAGKTHFARSLILAALPVPEDVPSPTYTLVQTYGLQTGEIWHADLYRLTDVSEIEELGMIEAFTNAVSLVEWPDRLGSLSPANALHISITPGDDENSRTIRLTWTDTRWDSLPKDLSDV